MRECCGSSIFYCGEGGDSRLPVFCRPCGDRHLVRIGRCAASTCPIHFPQPPVPDISKIAELLDGNWRLLSSLWRRPRRGSPPSTPSAAAGATSADVRRVVNETCAAASTAAAPSLITIAALRSSQVLMEGECCVNWVRAPTQKNVNALSDLTPPSLRSQRCGGNPNERLTFKPPVTTNVFVTPLDNNVVFFSV